MSATPAAPAAPHPPAIVPWQEIEYPLDLERPRRELDNLSLQTLAAMPFAQLGQFTASGRFPDGYPQDRATFYSPHDPGLHIVEAWVHMQVMPGLGSLRKNMYGFDDPLLASIVRYWCDIPNVLVVVNLDRTQLAGKHEQEIMALFRHGEDGNTIAVGDLAAAAPRSKLRDPLAVTAQPAVGEFAATPAPGAVAAVSEYADQIAEGASERGAISHLKLDVVNGRLRSSGSTNQSAGGELKQDNELTIDLNPIVASQAAAIIDLNHRIMRAQMLARGEGS